jgi:hypothetical protein
LTTSGATSRATCRGTRTRGVVEVVYDEPGDELHDSRGTRTRSVGKVVDDERHDEPLDEPRDVLRHPDARRRRSS